jgi:hypothetical protein
MSVYDDMNDLYDFDNVPDTYTPELIRHTLTINNVTVNGYLFNHSGQQLFVYRSNSKYNTAGQQMGNPWSVWSIDQNKHVVLGRKTREKAIQDALIMEV